MHEDTGQVKSVVVRTGLAQKLRHFQHFRKVNKRIEFLFSTRMHVKYKSIELKVQHLKQKVEIEQYLINLE